MPRTRVLTGATKQLDRARQRGKLDRRRAERRGDPAPQDLRAAFDAWLAAQVSAPDAAQVERIDLRAFLATASEVTRLAPVEVLRRLAIHLESELAWTGEQVLRSWLAVDRVYRAALRIEPRDVDVHDSRGITAQAFAAACMNLEGAWSDAQAGRRILAVAHGAAAVARELLPDDPYSAHRIGKILYDDPDGAVADALTWFERALALDPLHGWSRLFRAHCLQDVGRWAEAAAAYHALDAAFFVEERAWRYEFVLEACAHCRLEAGELAAAEAAFDALLMRWESNPHLAREAWGRYIERAAAGPLPSLLPRWQALFNAPSTPLR
jgi:tetratricopeptide (TPR) repeat protein